MQTARKTARRLRLVPVLGALGIALTALTPAPALSQACSTAAAATQWQCWEKSLPITTSSPINHYHDLRIKVTFSKGGVPLRETYAFWDGGSTMKFRMAFPESGSWTWTSQCQNPAGCSGTTCACNFVTAGANLTNQPLTVNAAPAPTSWPPPAGVVTSCANPLSGSWLPDLYTRGYPKVEDQGSNASRYLIYPDVSGQPRKGFFWLGDTAWNASYLASASEWNDTYLPARLGRGFSVLQIALPVDGTAQPTDRLGEKPFDTCTTTNPLPAACSKWNPAYWQEFDKKFKAANDCGFLVVVVGLMEGAIERNGSGDFCPPVLAESKVYARNVAARLAGYHVVLSPGFDRFSGSNQCGGREPIGTRIQEIGAEIEQTVPHLLKTNHWASRTDASEILGLQSATWLDFQLFQSGQAGYEPNTTDQLETLLFRARDLPAQLRAASPTLPNFNGEAIYDGACHQTLGRMHYNTYRARQAGYVSLFSGAFGYTMGVQGIFDWGKQANEICDGSASGLDYAGGLARPVNAQVQFLGNLFRDNLSWQALQPAPGLIKNNPVGVDEDKRILAARGTPGLYLLAYLPDRTNQEVHLDFVNAHAGLPKAGRWYDTRTGTFHPTTAYGQGTLVSGTTSTYRFCPPCSVGGVNPPCDPPGAPLRPTCPVNGDWVLVVP